MVKGVHTTMKRHLVFTIPLIIMMVVTFACRSKQGLAPEENLDSDVRITDGTVVSDGTVAPPAGTPPPEFANPTTDENVVVEDGTGGEVVGDIVAAGGVEGAASEGAAAGTEIDGSSTPPFEWAVSSVETLSSAVMTTSTFSYDSDGRLKELVYINSSGETVMGIRREGPTSVRITIKRDGVFFQEVMIKLDAANRISLAKTYDASGVLTNIDHYLYDDADVIPSGILNYEDLSGDGAVSPDPADLDRSVRRVIIDGRPTSEAIDHSPLLPAEGGLDSSQSLTYLPVGFIKSKKQYSDVPLAAGDLLHNIIYKFEMNASGQPISREDEDDVSDVTARVRYTYAGGVLAARIFDRDVTDEAELDEIRIYGYTQVPVTDDPIRRFLVPDPLQDALTGDFQRWN